ncbi:MAG: sugar-binding protein [Cytophagaceae bacterium]
MKSTFNDLTNIYLQRALLRGAALTFLATMIAFCSFGTAISSTAGGGAWNSTATWAGGVIPTGNDDVTIVAGATVTVPAAATCRLLTVNGTLNMTGTGITLAITNNSTTTAGLTLGSGSNLLIGATNILDFTTTQGTGITNNGGTIASTGTNGSNGGTIRIATCCGGAFNVSGSAVTTVYNFKFLSNANFNISSGGLLVNGTLSVADNNFSSSGSALSPMYGSASTLYINWNNQGISGGPGPLNNNLSKLWAVSTGTIGSTQGYPNNVTLVNMGASTRGVNVPPNVNVGWAPTGSVGLNGTLSLGDGTVTGFGSLDQVSSFSCGGVLVDNNSALVGPPAGAAFTDKGNFTLQGATTGLFYNFGATINFAGSGTSGSPQTISTTGASVTFPTMTVSNGTYVQLLDDVNITNTLTLTAGYVGTSATNSLSVTNTATTAVTGGSSTAFVDGPLIWSMAAGAGTYVFPTGSGANYLPFTFNKPATSALTATVQAFGTGSGGVGDATVGVLSSTEYWSFNTSAALAAGSKISVSRPTAIAPLVYLAESKTTATGTYTNIAGTVGANGISNSNDIGTGSIFYFTMAEQPIVSTLAATSITTTSATLNGAFNTGSSKTTSFSYGLTASYGTTVNSIHSPINSSSAKLDSQFVSGLTANTVYHYMASDGTDNGSDVVFVTAPNPPVVGTATSPTGTGFTAHWLAPAAMGSAAYTFTVQVSSDPTFATGVVAQSGISSGSTSFIFTTLSPETQYYYRVEAVNATANSVWSATSAPISTLIVATASGCVSGTGASTDPGAIAKTLSPPVIDGTADAVWATVPANVVSFVSVGSGTNTSTTWKAMWTTDTLYFLVQVQDPTLISQKAGLVGSTNVGVPQSTSGNYYDSDGVEITLDPDYSHGGSYDGLNDVQFRFNLGSTQLSGESCGNATQFCGTLFTNVASRIDYKIVITGTGYNVEAAIPWGHDAANPGINLTANPSTYGTASVNQPLGVEVQVNDATNTGSRTTQYSWFNGSPDPYQNPSTFAKAALYACAQPPIVILPTVTNITATGATLGATVSNQGDTPLSARGTGYTASPTTTGLENAAVEGGTGVGTPYSGPVRTNLTPQTKYYYLGYATNTNGGTGVSPVSSFYTLSALPTVQPVLTANPCTQMVLNWTSVSFPPVSQATQTGYLIIRATSPSVPTTAGITTRVATQQSALSAGNTLVATITNGSTLTYTDASAVMGVTYNYILVPFTWDGVTADSTYNYFITSPASVSASYNGALAAPGASATQQPTCAVPTGTITISPLDNTLTYSVDGTNFAAGPTFSGLSPNTYNVVAKNAGGCVSSPMPVTINAVPAGPSVPSATPVQPTCLLATGSITINSWNNTLTYSVDGTNYLAGPSFSGLVPNSYNVTAKDAAGCVSSSQAVTINPVPGAPVAPTASAVQPVCPSTTGSVAITSVAGLTYSIDGTNYFSSSDPSFSNLMAGTYQVTAKNASACVSSATSVTVNSIVCGDFIIPNLVTPNSDGRNDVFEISALPGGSALEVFNRWGEQIFKSSNYDNLWTGTGHSDGLYYYALTLPDGTQYKGWLNIIK